MKALIVKEDGLIYVNEVPEEPNHLDYKYQNEFKEWLWKSAIHMTNYHEDYDRYIKALASAIDSAILCADQKKAKDLIFKPGLKVIIDKEFSNGGEVTLLEWAKLYAKVKDDGEPWRTMKYRLTIKPGIYPIPDLQWEVREELIGVASNVTPFGSVSEFRQVAILKESPEQETLEDYLKRNKDKHEFRLVINENGKGYIHALGQDSETLDFQL